MIVVSAGMAGLAASLSGVSVTVIEARNRISPSTVGVLTPNDAVVALRPESAVLETHGLCTGSITTTV